MLRTSAGIEVLDIKNKPKKYLITGGAGFIGSNLIENLVNNSVDLVIIDDLSSGLLENIPKKALDKLINSQVQDIKSDEIDDIDGIFHLAAQASVPYSIDNFFSSSKNNLLSSLKVFEWAKELGIPVVYASSSAIYGNLSLGDDSKSNFEILSPYALDKLTMEEYASMMFNIYNVKSIGLRFFNVYGPKQDPSNPYSGVISIFIDRILRGKTITVNGGYQTRDFVYVDDIVNVMLKSMDTLNKNDICEFFNVGTGKSTSVDVLLNTIKEILNADPKVIKKELPKGDPEKSEGTYEKIREILNVDLENFVNLENGLQKTIKPLLI